MEDAWVAAEEQRPDSNRDYRGGLSAEAAEAAFAALQAPLRSELLPVEIATATADDACRDSSGYTAVPEEVTQDLQQDFVDTHLADLEAWVASVETP